MYRNVNCDSLTNYSFISSNDSAFYTVLVPISLHLLNDVFLSIILQPSHQIAHAQNRVYRSLPTQHLLNILHRTPPFNSNLLTIQKHYDPDDRTALFSDELNRLPDGGACGHYIVEHEHALSTHGRADHAPALAVVLRLLPIVSIPDITSVLAVQHEGRRGCERDALVRGSEEDVERRTDLLGDERRVARGDGGYERACAE